MNLSGKNKGLIVLSAAVIAVLAWQVYFLLTMPDGDTDAYAHFIIARDIVRNPYDLSLHWVWLPLFHYIDSLFVLSGAGMHAVRLMNVIVWSAIPFLVYYYAARKTDSVRAALISGIIAAAFPLGILMGTTAQPEPLFTLFLLLFVILFDSEKYFLSSVFVTAACMMRYEAWAALGFLSVYILYNFLRKKEGFRLSFGLLLNIIFPMLFLLIWSVLRYRSDGAWFQFLHGTMKFAGDALGEAPASGGILKIAGDLFFYVFWVPFIFTGIIAAAIPFGFKKFYAQNKILFVAGLGILIFITLSWVTKSNLGLNRHFTSLIPLYAVMAGYGIDAIIGKFEDSNKTGLAEKIVSALLIMTVTIYAVIWLYQYKLNNNKNFEGRFKAAEYLKTLEGSAPIICNDPMIEIFSGLDYRRFDHFFMADSSETNSYIKSVLMVTPEIIVVKVSVNPFLDNPSGGSRHEIPLQGGHPGVIRIYKISAGK